MAKRITEQCDEFGKSLVPKMITNDLKEHKQAVLSYMKRREFAIWASTAKVIDHIGNEENEKYCIITYSNGEYEWTGNDILYVEKYDMKISEDFVNRIESQNA